MITCPGCQYRGIEKGEELDLQSILISNIDLPNYWTELKTGPGIDQDRSTDSIGITFYSDKYPKSFGVSEDVYRFSSIYIAKYDFSYNRDYYSNGFLPETWTLKSKVADDSIFSCVKTKYDEFPICHWTARYKNIIIVFDAWLVPDRLTLKDVGDIVKTIDLKMEKIISE